MTDSIRRCYNGALRDDEFQAEAEATSKGNKRPGFLADELSKNLYALMYYGYIIGKYGHQYAKTHYPPDND